MLRKSFVLLAMGMVIFFFASVSSADVPDSINYQGKLTTASGGCLNDTVQMTFTIYADESGTVSEWSETQTQVVVKEGIFNVLLGSVNPLPASIFDGSAKYLGVQVESDPEMSPLKPMVSVGYSFHSESSDTAEYALNADKVDGYHVSDLDGRYVNEGQSNSISSGMIVDNSITQSDIAADGVGSAEIASNAVGASEIAASAVGTSEIANNSIDDSDMGFLRWGEWWGRYGDIIFQASGKLKVYLSNMSDRIYVQNLSGGTIVVGYAAHRDNTTNNVARVTVSAGATISFDVAWYADISININEILGDWSWFFKGLYSASSNGAIIVGYYNYFDSSPLKAHKENVPVKTLR